VRILVSMVSFSEQVKTHFIKSAFTHVMILSFLVASSIASGDTIFQEGFGGNSGAVGSLNGSSEDFAGATWSANGFATANGQLNVGQFEGSAVLPFQADVNQVYRLTMDVETISNRWVGLGFAEGGSTGVANSPQQRFAQTGGNGVAWFIYRPGTNNLGQQVQIFGGLNTANELPDNNFNFTGAITTRTLEVILDTTADLSGNTFQADFLIDGVSVSSGPQTVDLDISNINFVGFTFEGPNNGANPPITVDNFLLETVGSTTDPEL